MNNNIRIGKISAIDYASGLVRVVYHDFQTARKPVLSSAARGAKKTSRPRAEKAFTERSFRTKTAKPISAMKAAF